MSEFNTHAAYIQEIIFDSSTAKISFIYEFDKNSFPPHFYWKDKVFFSGQKELNMQNKSLSIQSSLMFPINE
jgi:hypothetical protein